MLYSIVSDIPGRLRLRCGARLFDEGEARGIAYRLMRTPGVRHAEVHPANGSILVRFDPVARGRVLRVVDSLDVLALPSEEVGTEDFCTAIEVADENNRFALRVGNLVAWRLIRLALLPTPLRIAWTVVRAAGFVREGLRRLLAGQLTVEVLDATAIVASLLRGSFAEAGTVMFLLQLSDAMETHVQSRAHLALKEGLVTRAENVWLVGDDGDVRISMAEVRRGQVLHLTAGSVLPVDGTVVDGEGSVDEASMTGEARPVRKAEGSTVYAGTALQDGDLRVRVDAPPGASRIDGIATMVERSQELKASVQGRAERLADGLVPYSFLAFFAIWGVTRNMTKAMTVLMVDYSCAIKLSTPIAVMSAMDEASRQRIVVKGGKYLEALAAADTVVFDKTGTLTHASPRVERVLSFDEMDEASVLRYSACIEEHFPHSMARAIVEEARRRGLRHEDEMHAEVRYVVAHGISTTVDGANAVIGSAHFVFEDEGVPRPDGLDAMLEEVAPRSSVVYLAIDSRLVGAICIGDPLREEAPAVLARLRRLGVRRLVMLTGDSERCASHVAAHLGIDEYHAQVLPEDKSSYVTTLRDGGHVVVMVGDGINDSPALATANVSVAMSDASDIARAVADVSVLDASLESLVTMRVLAQRLMRRIHDDYHLIVALNSVLIALGVAGVLPLTTAAYMHNGSTFAVAALNTRRLLPRGREAWRLGLPDAEAPSGGC
ncbi:heavy metal translocating P-type ATPase [Olsenella porci]|uniref:Heavy metal translocating P-type ATPase n=1 Tax=Olsenella porci TaxID=2652279 RepID=A0A6N7XRG6_9ACTN|nr:heavy metal translocating P-type ATPase [Olsenella porci]MST72519.1 heavy metal translocating P-type ATPase [Olsenella porci]